ncbi:hypothetical protein I553_5573 [Mycobacterium xenopi 4042]|uniref:Uncharacterized protein n=1 Tax=Mycobacterium xenopi 4042 TaxID=1299334 RepID=X7ZWY0_MYCXE|nr:hypothetical protein I553_5573 [Mycobacterium xenopi 4042]
MGGEPMTATFVAETITQTSTSEAVAFWILAHWRSSARSGW